MQSARPSIIFQERSTAERPAERRGESTGAVRAVRERGRGGRAGGGGGGGGGVRRVGGRKKGGVKKGRGRKDYRAVTKDGYIKAGGGGEGGGGGSGGMQQSYLAV